MYLEQVLNDVARSTLDDYNAFNALIKVSPEMYRRLMDEGNARIGVVKWYKINRGYFFCDEKLFQVIASSKNEPRFERSLIKYMTAL